MARSAEGNGIPIHLYEALGLKPMGVRKKVGRQWGKLLDVDLI